MTDYVKLIADNLDGASANIRRRLAERVLTALTAEELVIVPREPLAQVMQAIKGPGYLIRELQAISSIQGNACPLRRLDHALITAIALNKRRRHKLPPGECTTCDRERELGNEFHPSHDATERCQSGKHNHCTCDTCF